MERVNRTLQQSVKCQTLSVRYGRNILDVIIKTVYCKEQSSVSMCQQQAAIAEVKWSKHFVKAVLQLRK